MNPSRSEGQHSEADQTLHAIKEFTRYLEALEKDVSRMSKKLRNKETAQSAGFVATGIHEALHFLTIVKKVIEKTERVLRNKALDSSQTEQLTETPQ